MTDREPSSASRREEPARPRRRWPRRLAFVLLLVGTLVYFAPWLACRPAVRDAILTKCVPVEAGQLQVARVSLGWWWPTELSGVRYRSGDVELVAKSARCNRTLVDLLRDPKNLGVIEIASPRITLKQPATPKSADGKPATPANPSPRGAAASAPLEFYVDFRATGGSVTIVDAAGRSECVARDIEVRFTAAPGDDHATFQLGTRTGDPQATAHVAAKGTLAWPFDGSPEHVRDGQLDLVGVDARLLEHWLAKYVPAAAASGPGGAFQLGGLISGSAELRRRADAVECRTNFEVHDFAFAPAAAEWSLAEPTVSLVAAGNFRSNALALDSARLTSSIVSIDARGTIDELSGKMLAKLDGFVTCDWHELAPLIQQLSGEEIRLNGKDRRPWRLQGPLAGQSASSLVAMIEADLATYCDLAHVRGFDLGPLDLAGHWKDEVCRVDPVQFPFQDGRVNVQPTVRLVNGVPLLTIAPGRVLDQIKLTQQLCDGLLRYVDPLFNISGDFRGRLSLELDQFEMPLGDRGYEHATLSGRLIFDNVEFTPDRALAQVLAVAGLGPNPTIRTSQDIAIRLENGRVHHSGLMVPIGGDKITLDGWVGLDHSLSVRLSLPVTESMVGDKRIAKLLRGQRIELPVTGTIEQPRIPDGALTQGVQRLVRTAVRDQLEGDGEDVLRNLLKRTLK